MNDLFIPPAADEHVFGRFGKMAVVPPPIYLKTVCGSLGLFVSSAVKSFYKWLYSYFCSSFRSADGSNMGFRQA